MIDSATIDVFVDNIEKASQGFAEYNAKMRDLEKLYPQYAKHINSRWLPNDCFSLNVQGVDMGKPTHIRMWREITEFMIEHNGQPPTLRELKALTGLGSTSTVLYNINKLIGFGLISRDDTPGKPRNIALPGGVFAVPSNNMPGGASIECHKLVIIDVQLLAIAEIVGSLKTLLGKQPPIIKIMVPVSVDSSDYHTQILAACRSFDIDIGAIIFAEGATYAAIHDTIMLIHDGLPTDVAIVTQDRAVALAAMGMGCDVYDPIHELKRALGNKEG